MERQTDTQTNRQTITNYNPLDRQTDKQINKQTNKQTDRQTNRQTLTGYNRLLIERQTIPHHG